MEPGFFTENRKLYRELIQVRKPAPLNDPEDLTRRLAQCSRVLKISVHYNFVMFARTQLIARLQPV